MYNTCMKDGWLKKARARIVDEAISYICATVFTVILTAFTGMLIFWPGFRKLLSTEYYFELPLWAWIITAFVFSGLPLAVVLIKDRWNLLTDPDAIKNKLIWYLGKNKSFVADETYCEQPVVWAFAKIDKKMKLKRGSSQKYLPEIFKSGECPFPVKVEDVSSENIRLKYDFTPYLRDAGRFPGPSS